jgi:class 3 adenylate cyclase
MRALAFAVIVLIALEAMPFYPTVIVPVIALAAATLAMFVPSVAVLLVIVAFAIPLAAGNIGAGLAFLLIGLTASQYLGQANARAFLIIGLAFAASLHGAGWALVVIAGFLFGAGEGAVMALLACLAVEGAGVVFGKEAVGVLATGGVAPGLVDFSQTEPGTVILAGQEYAALGFKWLGPAFSAFDIPGFFSRLTDVRHVALLIAQPILWAIASAVTASVVRPPEDSKRALMAYASVTVGCAALTGASVAAMAATSGPVSSSTLAIGGAVSFAVSVAIVTVSEFVFRPMAVEIQGGAPSLHAEDADVDELLRVISTAEDALAAKHTVEAAVLITDMKSFSAMTEMDGSVLTAKAIQRHRDLLLPIVARHGGAGKSTGGDGLLAAFERPGDAVAAAVEMQRSLEAHNRAHETDRATSIRVGIAFGEVVVDKHGRPFIGDALNKSARIMDLADGGQIYAASEVLDMSPGRPPVIDHGQHAVKNIQDPIKVMEVLWAEGQKGRGPMRSSQPGPAVKGDGAPSGNEESTEGPTQDAGSEG